MNIPDGVTSIGAYAFQSCTGLLNINIPSSVTFIDGGAFWDCSVLTSITIPYGITDILLQTFGTCYGLTNVTLPESVTNITDRAFLGCTGLQNITIHSKDITIINRAFESCINLDRIIFMGNAPTLGSDIFIDGSADTKICYLFGNESFTGSVIDGKLNGYNAIPLFTVTYDGNGSESGSVPADENLYEAGNTASVWGNLGALDKTGFSFKGWNTKADKSGTTYGEGDNFAIDGTGHITLYAVWEDDTVISVDIAWGSMEFTYSDGIWNPETHEYEGTGWTSGVNANRISVTSSSNMPVTVSYSYTQEAGYLAVNGSFTNGINPVTSNELSAGDVTPQSCEVYLNLSGKPPECNINKIGSVTVTITE